MKLMSMTDFVLEQRKNRNQTVPECLNSIFGYADFLKQPLTPGMFVPCDEDGRILEEPNEELELSYWDFSTKQGKYQQSKERVLFEGFEIIDNILYHNVNYVCSIEALNDTTIEDLTHPLFCDNELTLTQSAIKQIGL